MPKTKQEKSVVERLRKELGLTQGEFAEKVGVSRRTIQEIEYGGDLSWKSARAISVQFNVKADWLMKNDPDRPMTTVSGAPWSQKQRNNLQPLKRGDPIAKAAALVVAEKACKPLLEDYIKFRAFFTFAAFIDPEELDRWREIQNKAWNEFLEDNPALAEWSKETLSGDALSRADLESIKEDVEMVLQMPALPIEKTTKKADRKRDSLF